MILLFTRPYYQCKTFQMDSFEKKLLRKPLLFWLFEIYAVRIRYYNIICDQTLSFVVVYIDLILRFQRKEEPKEYKSHSKASYFSGNSLYLKGFVKSYFISCRKNICISFENQINVKPIPFSLSCLVVYPNLT